MDIGNPNTANVWISDNGARIRCKAIQLGAWDMNAVGTKNIPHGISDALNKIIHVTVSLIRDPVDIAYLVSSYDNYPDTGSTGISFSIYPSSIVLNTAETFGWRTSPFYVSTSINRGWLYIIYKE